MYVSFWCTQITIYMICTILRLITHITVRMLYTFTGEEFNSNPVWVMRILLNIYKILRLTRGKGDHMINVYRNICMVTKTITVAQAYHEYR